MKQKLFFIALERPVKVTGKKTKIWRDVDAHHNHEKTASFETYP
jgi:hypothetical protein